MKPSKLIVRHSIAWASFALAGAIFFTAPWWWQKVAALPCASLVAVVSITAGREADRHRALLAGLETFAHAMKPRSAIAEGVPPNLVPYIDPIRASHRTGQIVYQFVRPSNSNGAFIMTTTLEQLIASFLQVGLAKLDTKLSATTQQSIDSVVPTLVSTIASVIVDLAENHKAARNPTAVK